MPSTRHHAEWLSLVEIEGPFLTLPVLERVFPQGLDKDDSPEAKALSRNLRLAFEEWEDNQTGKRPIPPSTRRGSTSCSSRRSDSAKTLTLSSTRIV